MEVFMSKGKWKTPKTDKKVQVGGKMNPDLAAWVKLNGGFPMVEKAVELYKNQIEDSKMSIQNTLNDEAINMLPIILSAINNAEEFEANQMRDRALRECNNSLTPISEMNESDLKVFQMSIIDVFKHFEWM